MANIMTTQSLFPILGQHHASPDSCPPLRGIARMAAQSPQVNQGHQVDFHTLQVRSILNRTNSRRGLTFTRSINPYRGCEFACQYCYARYTHEFMELRDPHAFERQIFIKQNAAWLLQQELRQLGREESIAIGTATDPYQPMERSAEVTRSLLEILTKQRGLRLGIVTKSTLILRDIELLQQISANNRLTINITITTLDAQLARILEPRAPRPDLRVNVVATLRRSGLCTGVLCSPLMPGITDSYAAIDSVALAAKHADASFFHASPLFLKPGSKHVFEEFLQQHFPEQAEAYRARYEKSAFVSSAYHKRIQQMVKLIQKKHRMGRTYGEVQPRLVDTNRQINWSYFPGCMPNRLPASLRRREDATALTLDDHFTQVVLRQKKLAGGKCSKQLLNRTIRIHVQQGVIGTFLHLHIFTIRQVVATECRHLASGAGMKETENFALRFHTGVQTLHHTLRHGCRNIIQCVPQQNHIKHAMAKIHMLVDESICIVCVGRTIAGLYHPGRLYGLFHQICHEDAMAKIGQIVDIARRRGANVEHTQALLRLQAHQCLAPAA